MARQCNDCGDCGVDVIVPKPCDPNHGTAADPKQILCDASLKGKMCQICPYHIVCDGGADSNMPTKGKQGSVQKSTPNDTR